MKHFGSNPITGHDPSGHLETPGRRARRLRRQHDDDIATILGMPERSPTTTTVNLTRAERLLLAMYGPQALEISRTRTKTTDVPSQGKEESE